MGGGWLACTLPALLAWLTAAVTLLPCSWHGKVAEQDGTLAEAGGG